jgi:membrane protease YdiL (CAAX protease family)
MVKRLPLLFWPAVAAAVTASMLSVKPCTNAGMEPSPFRFEEPHGALAAFVLVVAVMLVVRYIRTPQRTGSASGTTFSHMGSSRKELLFHVAWSSCLMVGFPLVWIALRENLPALPQALLRLPAIGLLPVVLVVGALYFFSPGPGMGQAAPFKLGHVWAALPYFVFRAGMPEEFLFRFCILQASFHAWGAWPAMAFNVCLF